MRESSFVRSACALLVVLSASISIHSIGFCHAATFLPVYAGPTATGGLNYFVNPAASSEGQQFWPNEFAFFPTFYGAVNNSGLAVGNVLQEGGPANLAGGNATAVTAEWSATRSVQFLTPSSPTADTMAFAINDAGIVVGESDPTENIQLSSSGYSEHGAGGMVAEQWNASGAITTLTGLGSSAATPTLATAINNQGTSIVLKEFGHGTGRWDANSTTAVTLGPSVTPYSAYAYGINNSGTIVGMTTAAASLNHQALYWTPGQTTATILPDLGDPAGSTGDSAAFGLNNSGTAVGYATAYNSGGVPIGMRPVVWNSQTAVTQLTDLDPTGSNLNAYALAINDAGTIIGNDGQPSTQHAVLWAPGSTTPTELALLVPSTPNLATSAYAINSQGQVVGSAATSFVNNVNHAVLWNADGSVVDLNSLISPSSGWTLNMATAISDTDWILGVGTFNGNQSLFLLQVPEPSTLVLAALTAIGLAFYNWRRT